MILWDWLQDGYKRGDNLIENEIIRNAIMSYQVEMVNLEELVSSTHQYR